MNPSIEKSKSTPRRHDIDWLRSLAFTAVFFYHCARFFDQDGWHIKNITTSDLVTGITSIFDLWGMPLLFLISGASITFALRPGRTARFLRDRVSRLVVPLAFGILVLAPPQIYLERLTHGDFQGSFLDFLPQYFGDWRRWGGDFAWSGVHLWYLEDLFLFTLALLPLFAALKSQAGRRFTEFLARQSARPGVIFLWALPFAVVPIAFDPLGIVGPGLSEDLTRLVVFPPFLVMGFLVFSDDRIQRAAIRQRRVALALALLFMLISPFVPGWIGEHAGYPALVTAMVMLSLLIWATILAILGYGMRYLTASNPLLAYANEAVLPFYILHQPVILMIGYFIIPLPLPILVKYLTIAPLAFGTTLALYEFGVRRWNPVRRLFGLKPLKPVLPVAELAPQPAS